MKPPLKILVTGAGSGAGKFLAGYFNGTGMTMENAERVLETAKAENPDVIIHAAFNQAYQVSLSSLNALMEDNLFLTERLLDLNPGKFVYFSTVDVYAKDKKIHDEKEDLAVGENSSPYALMKMMAEARVMAKRPESLILRCTSLLGEWMRKNSFTRLFEEDAPRLSLSPDSQMNYVRVSDVGAWIKTALEKGLCGIYNIASAQNVAVSEIGKALGKEVVYGSYRYDAGLPANAKAASVNPVFLKTSKEVVEAYAKERYGASLRWVS